MDTNPKFSTADLQDRYHQFTFPGKRADEEIILLLRRHWLIFVFKFLPLFAYLVVLIVFSFIGQDIFLSAGIQLSDALFGLMLNFMMMAFWTLLFVVWVNYYLDVWIVTNQRIIDIEQFGFFRRRVSEMEYSKIQDVTSDVQGLVATLFNYGFIHVQTAGEVTRFVFQQIPNPVGVKDAIMQIQQRAILEEKKIEGAIMRGKY